MALKKKKKEWERLCGLGGEEKDGTEDEEIFIADGTSEELEEILADLKNDLFLRNGNIQMSRFQR